MTYRHIVCVYRGELWVTSNASVVTRSFNGTTSWLIDAVSINAVCKSDLRSWPRDSKLCAFSIGLLTLDGNMIIENIDVKVSTPQISKVAFSTSCVLLRFYSNWQVALDNVMVE